MDRSYKKKVQTQFFVHYMRQNIFTVIASGDSMIPAISEGDILTVKVIKEHDQIKIGDIIFVKNPILLTENLFIAHRLLKVIENDFIAKGDNCSHADPKISFSNVIGVVEHIQRKGANNDS